MSKWNFADVWEAVADELPDAPALVHGARTLTWREFDHRADNLARWLLGAGRRHQDKVALYLYNCSEYLETTFACFKIGLVPINTNYRYADDELVYLWENADTVAVVFHGVLRRADRGNPRPASRRPELAVGRRRDGDLPAVGRPLRGGGRDHRRRRRGRARAGAGPVGPRAPTTSTCSTPVGPPGMPKGVMWRQDDLFARLNGAGFRRYPEDGGPDDVRAELAAAAGRA